MEALSLCGYKKRNIKLILQTDEEVSSRYSNKRTVDFLYEHGKDSVAFLNLEGYSAGKCTVMRKGIIRYKVTVTGVAAHSSRCYEGISAVKEAAHKIIALESLSEGKEGITVNCGIISGGTAENTVPAECVFTVDLRFPTQEKFKNADEQIRKIVDHSYLEGTTSVISIQSKRPAMELEERNTRLLSELNRAFSECGLPTLTATASTGGSDAADMTARGLAAVDSLGTDGGYIHSKNEYSNISSLKESAKRIIAAALYL
jgi:glutamate carboxypeptidase